MVSGVVKEPPFFILGSYLHKYVEISDRLVMTKLFWFVVDVLNTNTFNSALQSASLLGSYKGCLQLFQGISGSILQNKCRIASRINLQRTNRYAHGRERCRKIT